MFENFFIQAELALAAYANLTTTRPDEAALVDAGMSGTQAAQFAADWQVVNQYTDPWSGFSATLFEKEGQRYLAIRGTNDPIDLLADADLALFSGVAAKQTVALYNYVQRLKGVKGEAVAQLEWSVLQQSYVLNPTGAVGLLDAPLSGPITVAGHSLGSGGNAANDGAWRRVA